MDKVGAMEKTNYEPTNPTDPDLVHRLTNHPPIGNTGELLDAVTQHMIWMGTFIQQYVPVGREQSLALTKLEELSMWVKAGIARNQGE